MYLKRCRLKNIACFTDLSLDFTQEDGQPCSWVVLLGENGTGKSTILQMMALALLGRDLVYQVASEIDWPKFVRQGGEKGRVEIVLVPTNSDKRVSQQKAYQAAFEIGRTAKTARTGLEQDRDFSPQDYGELDETLYNYTLTGGWFACGYGPWRRLPPPKSIARSSLNLSQSQRKSQRFVTVFNPEEALTVIGDWLVDLEFRRLKADQPDDIKAAQRSLDLAKQAIETILPNVQFKEITANGEVLVVENGVTVSIDNLSDGYRSALSWVVDLVRRLIDAFPKMDNPLAAEGVVLVDEIALHLHPKWQRKIVGQIRQSFPNLQFIVTSHSPFVAQEMSEQDKIIALKKEQDAVTAIENEVSVKDWRVDQILTSYLFDLNTTRSVTIATMEQEYERLLNLRTTPDFTPEDAQRLADIKAWLDQHQSPLGETDAENELYDTAQALIDILDEHLTE